MSNTNIMDTAILAEKQVDYIHKDHKDPYELAHASVWALNKNGEITCRQVGPDVYELLDSSETLNAIKGVDFFGILTCGWAASMDDCDDDVPPSQAKGRRRVRLFVAAGIDGAVSVLRFADNPDEIITDEGKARGSLAEAIMELYDKKVIIEMTEGMKNEN